jgi:hypothetical protein
MKPFLEIAVVAGGYVVAFLMASAAAAVRVANTRGPDAQASSGMYAFGDALLFVAVFGVSALVPTGAVLFFLRPYRHFWIVLSALGLAVAFTGVTAVILFAVGRHATLRPSRHGPGSPCSGSSLRHSSLLPFSCVHSSRRTAPLGSRF